MTEEIGHVVGGFTALLVAAGAWVGLFLSYIQGLGTEAAGFLMLYLVFTPWGAVVGSVVGIVLTVTLVAAFLGGGALGAALARRSMAHD